MDPRIEIAIYSGQSMMLEQLKDLSVNHGIDISFGTDIWKARSGYNVIAKGKRLDSLVKFIDSKVNAKE